MEEQLSPQAQAALAAVKSLSLAEQGKLVSLVVTDLAAEIAKKVSTASPEQIAKASSKIDEGVKGTEAAQSATTSPAVTELKQVDGHLAVVGKITANGQQLDTLLSEGSFNKSREDQIAYAEKLGYRMATREEHVAYVKDLLAKEDNNTINEAEKNALKTYRERYVRDTQGGLNVAGRRGVRDFVFHGRACGYPRIGALFVRASSESK
jgi:hypothetical protein